MALTLLVETEEVSVYGPPESITIVSDIGARGERGNKIFSNIGDPDSYTSSSGGVYSMNNNVLKLGDLYYRVDNDSFYQWAQLPTGPVWQSRSGFNNFFRTSHLLTFTSGVASMSVPLTDLWVDTGTVDLLSNNVCVTLAAISTDRVFVTLTSKSLDGSVPRNLDLEFFGYKMNPTTLTGIILNGNVEINMTISLII